MILLRRRAWAASIAVVLLLASLPGLRHLDRSDDFCAIPVEGHDESKHAIGAAQSAEHRHCAICHWTRLSGRPLQSAVIARAALADGSALHAFQPLSLRAPASDRLPARAPPVQA